MNRTCHEIFSDLPRPALGLSRRLCGAYGVAWPYGQRPRWLAYMYVYNYVHTHTHIITYIYTYIYIYIYTCAYIIIIGGGKRSLPSGNQITWQWKIPNSRMTFPLKPFKTSLGIWNCHVWLYPLENKKLDINKGVKKIMFQLENTMYGFCGSF